MTYFEWADPPKRVHRGKTSTAKEVAEALLRIVATGQVGRWARIDPDITGSQAHTIANRIKSGSYTVAVGNWDAVSRSGAVYVRFMGFGDDA